MRHGHRCSARQFQVCHEIFKIEKGFLNQLYDSSEKRRHSSWYSYNSVIHFGVLLREENRVAKGAAAIKMFSTAVLYR